MSRSERAASTPFIGIREASEASASVKAYLHAAIRPSTRTTYQTAMANYEKYAESMSWEPGAPITERRTEEWLAALADGGQLMTSTIRTYKAALSTHHEETSTLPNPVSSERISRLVAGIENSRTEREAKRRREKPKCEGFTPEMFRAIEIRYRQGSDKELMMIGAAALLTHTGSRPSEVLGNRTIRPLLAEQVRFFAQPSAREPMPPTEAAGEPDHCTVELRGSKTNQQQRSQAKYVSAACGVRALWRWWRKRESSGGSTIHGPELFKLKGRRPLTTTNLVGFITRAAAEAGLGDLSLGGKSFRIGSTSALAAAGTDAADLRGLGGWQTNMWRTYADAESKRQRAILIGRRL